MTPKKKTGGVPDANQKTPPVVLDRLHGIQNSAPSAGVKKKFWNLEEIPSKSWGTAIDRYIRKGRAEMHLPPWMEQAEEWPEITAARFVELRKLMLQLKAVQCAALLRVHVATVWRWESGEIPVPFAAYMALRLLLDVRYLPHQVKEWDGWKIINAGVDVGMLYDSKKTGEMFSPSELRATRWVKGERDAWKTKAEKADARAAELEAENTRLRKLYREQGITRELRQMHERIGALLEGVGTADLHELNSPLTGIQVRDKAA
ncbi:MAG: hypothetical protein Q8O52_00145 [Sulfuritalea sp.]|nr:hypothetical protein [Sulfuritalea sp.]